MVVGGCRGHHADGVNGAKGDVAIEESRGASGKGGRGKGANGEKRKWGRRRMQRGKRYYRDPM